ncbi:NUDIX domain-containing protein [Prauserella oleivorans]|uniref:NUDIX domain-containing protein n=1 Tax=Prauserella oleivorans TaxID=1478153 RepID=A0ABW5WBF5_9PSEU
MNAARTDHAVTLAAGAVLWRPAGSGELEIAVVHRPRYDDWSLPKGKLDPGETPPVAAVRELEEETGFDAVLGRFLKRVEYPLGTGRKTVDYFSARAGEGRFRPNEEVDELRWCSPAEAAGIVSYDTDRDVLRAFTELPADLTSVLLVRHGKAGKREEWAGDDDLRPLSDAGARQAQALRRLLWTFRPTRVLSAPLLRCVQTVQGLADDLGLEVVQEPMLSEKSYRSDPEGGRKRFLEIAAEGGTPVVCSQGGVIPGILSDLAERERLTLASTTSGGVAAKKGSVWQLSFATGEGTPRLVAANYLPSALPTPVPTTS